MTYTWLLMCYVGAFLWLVSLVQKYFKSFFHRFLDFIERFHKKLAIFRQQWSALPNIKFFKWLWEEWDHWTCIGIPSFSLWKQSICMIIFFTLFSILFIFWIHFKNLIYYLCLQWNYLLFLFNSRQIPMKNLLTKGMHNQKNLVQAREYFTSVKITLLFFLK